MIAAGVVVRLVLFALTVSVAAAIGDVNQACATNLTCNDPAALCDSATSLCKIAAGKSCSGDTEECLSGSECLQNVCKCIPPRTAYEGECVLVTAGVGEKCTTMYGRSACLDDKARCVTQGHSILGICSCIDSFMPAGDNTCKRVPGSTNADCIRGYTCLDTNDTCNIGRCKTMPDRSCSTNFQCVSMATCDLNLAVCSCTPPYYADQGICVSPPRLVYGPCNPMDKEPCLDSNAECSGHLDLGTCLCRQSYTTTNRLTCEAQAGSLNGSCIVNSDCDDENAECSSQEGSICLCKDGYEHTIKDRCLPAEEVGITKGECGMFSTCKNSTDVCSSQQCKKMVGKNCSSTEGQVCVDGASCVDKICTCRDSLTPINGRCYRIQKTVGGTCNPADELAACSDVNAECQGSGDVGVCICKSGLQTTMDGFCSSLSTTVCVSLLLLLMAFVTSQLL